MEAPPVGSGFSRACLTPLGLALGLSLGFPAPISANIYRHRRLIAGFTGRIFDFTPMPIAFYWAGRADQYFYG